MGKQKIKAVQLPCDSHGNPLDYIVGKQGVTAILSTVRNGEYCTIPYIEVWAGPDLILTACEHKCSFVEYFVPNQEQP